MKYFSGKVNTQLFLQYGFRLFVPMSYTDVKGFRIAIINETKQSKIGIFYSK